MKQKPATLGEIKKGLRQIFDGGFVLCRTEKPENKLTFVHIDRDDNPPHGWEVSRLSDLLTNCYINDEAKIIREFTKGDYQMVPYKTAMNAGLAPINIGGNRDDTSKTR